LFFWGIRCADVFYLPLAARRQGRGMPHPPFQSPLSRRRKNSRANRRHPGAAHTLRSKEGGLFPGWRQFARLAPTGRGASLQFEL